MASIARNASSSVGQVVASALIMFALYRAILETLGAEHLGIWSIVLATASSSRIAEFGLSASVTRFVAKYRAQGDELEAGYAVQTAVLSIAAFLTVILLSAYPLLSALFERLFIGTALDEARGLLPYALASLLLTSVAGVFLSGLDGCQRYDWRALLVVSGQLLFLVTALWLTPRHGLKGLAWAQIGQSAVLAAVGWRVLRRALPSLPLVPCQWRRASFREMLGYGLQFQIGAIAMMLFDPVTKALLGKYGGLSAAGFYEMANQLVSKARALVVSANQVLVPAVAGLSEQDPGRMFHLYRSNLRLLFLVVFPLYAVVAAWAPLVSELWIGHYEPRFNFFVALLAWAWCLNTFTVPAYFCNMGTGHIAWNTLSHVWIGVANAGLGLVLGPAFGVGGVVWGMAIALVTGSVLIVASFHLQQHISWRPLFPREGIPLVLAGLALAVVSNGAYQAMVEIPTIARFLVCIFLPLLILGPPFWHHPLRPVLQGRIHTIVARGPTGG